MSAIPTKSVLINYAGYPVSPCSLVPDNGLANLAGSLIKNNHKTKIFDYSTVEFMKDFFPPDYSIQLQNIMADISANLNQNKNPDSADLEILYSLDVQLNQLQKKKVEGITNTIHSYIKKNNVDFVGFKLWTGDGFENSIKIAENLKKSNPNLYIFGGGPHVDWFKERILTKTNIFDVLVYGEGEETITELTAYVEGKKKLEEIPNLIYKKNGSIITTEVKRITNLDTISPVYDEEIYPAMKGNQKIKMILIDESRGCPNSCNFCIHPIKSGNRWRTRSPKGIVDFMENMIEKYHISTFRFAGSNTPAYLKEGIAEEILKRKLDIQYAAFGHVKGASKQNFELLKKSGCYSLFFGIESGSQNILDESMNKKIKVGDIRRILNNSKEAGILNVGSVIIPAPGETKETLEKTINLLLELKPDSVTISLPGVIPGTMWEREHDRFGITFLDPTTYIENFMNYKIKMLFPPILWDPLPYNINNKPFKEYVKEAGDFTRTLEKAGILTQVPDEMLLMAKYVGISARHLRDKCVKYFSMGDYKGMKNIVKKINRGIQFNN